MKKIRLVKCVFLLFILCACTTQPAMQPESKNPITEIPEQAESQSTALEPGNSESREQAEVQDSQSENPAQAAFTGGITLYADSRTAYVNSRLKCPPRRLWKTGISISRCNSSRRRWDGRIRNRAEP